MYHPAIRESIRLFIHRVKIHLCVAADCSLLNPLRRASQARRANLPPLESQSHSAHQFRVSGILAPISPEVSYQIIDVSRTSYARPSHSKDSSALSSPFNTYAINAGET